MNGNRQPATGNRRDFLKSVAAGASAYGIPSPALEAFVREVQQGQYQWKFFTGPELATMRVLADLIIPRDEHGPAATESGTVEYADFQLSISSDNTKQAWHDGLAWLDAECSRRFQATFTQAADAQRRQVLDDIAWPARAREELRTQVSWFNRARDLVASGHFSSQPGIDDLGYIGGVFNPEWRGAPPEALAELRLSYEEWDRKYGGAR